MRLVDLSVCLSDLSVCLGVVQSGPSQRRPPQTRRTGFAAEASHSVDTGFSRETRLQLTLNTQGEELLPALLLLFFWGRQEKGCGYLVHVPAVRPVAAGSRWTGSTGVSRILQTLHAGHALVARIWRTSRTRLVEPCRGQRQVPDRQVSDRQVPDRQAPR